MGTGSTRPPAATLVGEYPQTPGAGATQPVSGIGGNDGYNQPAGGFSSVPANYGGVARPTQPTQLPPGNQLPTREPSTAPADGTNAR